MPCLLHVSVQTCFLLQLNSLLSYEKTSAYKCGSQPESMQEKQSSCGTEAEAPSAMEVGKVKGFKAKFGVVEANGASKRLIETATLVQIRKMPIKSKICPKNHTIMKGLVVSQIFLKRVSPIQSGSSQTYRSSCTCIDIIHPRFDK